MNHIDSIAFAKPAHKPACDQIFIPQASHMSSISFVVKANKAPNFKLFISNGLLQNLLLFILTNNFQSWFLEVDFSSLVLKFFDDFSKSLLLTFKLTWQW